MQDAGKWSVPFLSCQGAGGRVEHPASSIQDLLNQGWLLWYFDCGFGLGEEIESLS
jgi:hypothetical protein